MTMTNPMLAELDEVVRLIAKEEKEEAGKPLSILRDNEELDNACYWFMKNHHATLADMAKRMEAAERDAARYRWLRVAKFDEAMRALFVEGTRNVRNAEKMLDAAIDAAQEGEG